MHWVESQQQQNAEPPHCPVCNVPYVIAEKNSQFLKWYSHAQQRWDRASMVLALGTLAGGVWASSAVCVFFPCYLMSSWEHCTNDRIDACWAIRTFAGEDVASALLYRRRWPLAYFCAPSLPPPS